jgi:hypothetical protein
MATKADYSKRTMVTSFMPSSSPIMLQLVVSLSHGSCLCLGHSLWDSLPVPPPQHMQKGQLHVEPVIWDKSPCSLIRG